MANTICAIAWVLIFLGYILLEIMKFYGEYIWFILGSLAACAVCFSVHNVKAELGAFILVSFLSWAVIHIITAPMLSDEEGQNDSEDTYNH